MGSKSVSVRDYALLFTNLSKSVHVIEDNLDVVRIHSRWLKEHSESFEGAAKEKALEVVKTCEGVLEDIGGDVKSISVGLDKLIAAAEQANKNAAARGESANETAQQARVRFQKR